MNLVIDMRVTADPWLQSTPCSASPRTSKRAASSSSHERSQSPTRASRPSRQATRSMIPVGTATTSVSHSAASHPRSDRSPPQCLRDPSSFETVDCAEDAYRALRIISAAERQSATLTLMQVSRSRILERRTLRSSRCRRET